MRAGFVFVLSALACANHKLPPGNELENPDGDAEGEANTVGDSRMPTSSNELAKAFEPPPPPTPAKQAPSATPLPPPDPDTGQQERQAFSTRSHDHNDRGACA